MADEIQTAMTFEERMKARIKESIGDMVTDEELSKIVSSGIHSAFFEPHYEKSRYGVGFDIIKEPLIINIVKECVRLQVEVSIKNWFEQNPDVIKSIIDEVIKNGLTKTIFDYFNNQLSSALYQFRNNVTEEISKITGR